MARSWYGIFSSRSHNSADSATASKTMNPSAHRHNCDSSRSRFPGERGVRDALGESKLIKERPILVRSHPTFYMCRTNSGIVGHLGTRRAKSWIIEHES